MLGRFYFTPQSKIYETLEIAAYLGVFPNPSSGRLT